MSGAHIENTAGHGTARGVLAESASLPLPKMTCDASAPAPVLPLPVTTPDAPAPRPAFKSPLTSPEACVPTPTFEVPVTEVRRGYAEASVAIPG